MLEGGEQHNRETVHVLRKELKLAGLRVTLDTMIEADYKHRYKDKHQRTRAEGPYRAAILPLYVLMSRLAERTDKESYWHHVAEKELHPTILPQNGRWLRGAVQNVEIINARGELERVHFPVCSHELNDG